MTKRALLVMAKRPFPGKTKTRLVPPLSFEEAAQLYECFLQDVLDLVRIVPDATPFIAYAPQEEAAYFEQLAPDFNLVPQIGDTLSERLEYVMSTCSAAGFAQVVAMNSDSPTLPASYLQDAFAHLDEPGTDIVLGPCEDGGYYLIGWKRPFAPLIRQVEMSTPHVLEDTLVIAKANNLHVTLLPTWYDTDTIIELNRLKEELLQNSHHATQSYLFFNKMTNMTTRL